jgi:hypothetical protein
LGVDFCLVSGGAEHKVRRYANKAMATPRFAALDRFQNEIAALCLK